MTPSRYKGRPKPSANVNGRPSAQDRQGAGKCMPPPEATDGIGDSAAGAGIATADVTVFFVHGIGNQRPGEQVARWGRACLTAAQHVPGWDKWTEGSMVTGRIPVSDGSEMAFGDVVLTRGETGNRPRSKRIRFAEANWSGVFPRPWGRTVLWLLKAVPALLLLFAFDSRDKEAFAAPASTTAPDSGWRGALAAVKKGAGAAARSATGHLPPDAVAGMRLLARFLMAFFLFSLFLGFLTAIPRLCAWFLGAAALLLVLHPRTNWANHVVVAMEGAASYDTIRGRVESCLAAAAEHSAKVLVVGHSQGGFIAHDTISRSARPGNVETFVGLGSGLKPITLLRVLKRPRVLAAAWVLMLAGVAASVVLVIHLDVSADILPLRVLRWSFVSTFMAIVDPFSMAAALRHAPQVTGDDYLPWSGLKVTGGRLVLAALGLYALAVVSVGRLLRNERFDLDFTGISRVDWTEISSPHDVVGRLLYPALPERVTQITVTLGGNPLVDHTSYFRSASPIPLFLLELALRAATNPARGTHLIGQSVIQDLHALGQRRRRVRDAVVWGVLGAGGLWAMLLGKGLRAAVVGLLPILGAVMLGAALVLLAREVRFQRRALSSPAALEDAQEKARRARRQLSAVTRTSSWCLTGSAVLMWIAGGATSLIYGPNASLPLLAVVGSLAMLGSAIAYFGGYRIRSRWVLLGSVSWLALLVSSCASALTAVRLPVWLIPFTPGFLFLVIALSLGGAGWGLALWRMHRLRAVERTAT